MILKINVDTDDMFDGEEFVTFEKLFTDELRRQMIRDCRGKVASEKFEEFSRMASEAVMAEIKLKLENFISEEISLTDRWGKTTFVGSIEDLFKKGFDDILLRPVDSSGKTLKGCTADGNTWIEWRIKHVTEDRVKRLVEDAKKNIEFSITEMVKKKLVELKDGAIKRQVDDAFVKILNR